MIQKNGNPSVAGVAAAVMKKWILRVVFITRNCPVNSLIRKPISVASIPSVMSSVPAAYA